METTLHTIAVVVLNLVLFTVLGCYIFWLFKQSTPADKYQAWLLILVFVLLVIRQVTLI